MAGKKGGTYGPNSLRHFLRCEWCGCEFASARPETRCCSNAHKLRFHRFQRAYAAQFGATRPKGPRGDTAIQSLFRRHPGC